MNELLKKLRRYEIRIRKAINSQLQGNFHSIFKGSGLEFDDVRPYQYGDEVRAIDWNISAKGHGAFVKTFREEKEQTIFFILDVSASQHIGEAGRSKLDIAREICGVLTLSGARESNQIGLIGYSDAREVILKPKKGIAHAYAIICRLAKLAPLSKGTDLRKAFAFAVDFIRRKSVVIVISDFIDEDYHFGMAALARKHDLIAIHINDRRETLFPQLGIVPVRDQETGRKTWVNTSFGPFRERMVELHLTRRRQLRDFCRKRQINFLSLRTDEDYVPQLLKLFSARNRLMKSG